MDRTTEKSSLMRVRVDGRKCQGHNRCVVSTPEVFQADELGYSHVLVDEVPPELQERVLLAVKNCPERAISVEQGE